MTNRIDPNRSSPPTQTTSAEQTSGAAKAGAAKTGEAPDEAKGAPAQPAADPFDYFGDQWDQTCQEGEEFFAGFSGGPPLAQGAAMSSADSVSVLELQAQSSAAAKSDDSLANNPMAAKLEELLGGDSVTFDDIRYCTDTARTFGPINQAVTGLSASERKALAEIVADPDKARAFFKEALAGRDDIPDGFFTDRNEHLDEACDALIEEAKTAIVGNFEEQVAERVQGIVRNASQPFEAINASSETRRAFLGQLAQLEGDPAKLEERLSAFGLDEGAAKDIAQVLADAHGDPQAIEALVSGEEGPDRAGFQLFEEGNAYAFAEEVLQEELGDKLELLEQFGRQAGNGQITDSLLTNDNFKSLRDKVLSEMEGGKGGPIEQIVAEHTEQVESEGKATGGAKLAVTIGTAIAATLATSGLGGPAAVGTALAIEGAQAAPDLLVAFEDFDLAELAARDEFVMPDGTKVSMGMTDDEAVDDARHNRNVTVACAVASLALGGVPMDGAAAVLKNGTSATAVGIAGAVAKE